MNNIQSMNNPLDWIGYDFERNGWSTTRENHSDAFDKFIRVLRSYLKDKAKLWYLEALPFKQNWFEASGFVKNLRTGKLAYWSISDVRYFKDEWRTKVMYRTAQHEKDYSGGSNHYCTLEELMPSIAALTDHS